MGPFYNKAIIAPIGSSKKNKDCSTTRRLHVLHWLPRHSDRMSSTVWNNPVHPGYMADPFIFSHNGMFYAIGTGQETSGEKKEADFKSYDNVFPLCDLRICKIGKYCDLP